MSFEEKSAWGSLIAISAASWLFFPLALSHTENGGSIADLVPRLVFVIGVIIVIEIVYHSIIAAKAGKENRDERDVEISLRADRISGYVLAFGVIWIVGLIMARSAIAGAPPPPSSLLTSIYLLLVLTVSEASKLMSQIWHYRISS